MHRTNNPRGKAILAAAAVLLLSASSAPAGINGILIDTDASFLSLAGSTMDVSVTLGHPPGTDVVPITAQTDFSGGGANGLVAHYGGYHFFDVQPTSIQPLGFGPGYIMALGSIAPNWQRGLFFPEGTNGAVSGSIVNTGVVPPGPWDYGNYGWVAPAVGAFARSWDLNIAPTSAFGVNGPMPQVAPNTYAESSQIWGFVYGYQDVISGLGGTHTDYSAGYNGPFPLPLTGSLDITPVQAGTGPAIYVPGNATATWDTETLRLNFNSSVTYIFNQNPLVTATQVVTGQLVMHPTVPEPSTMTLMGCGVAGIVSCARRARRRRHAHQI